MASFAAWNPSFELGVPEIDEQHRLLFKAVSDMHDAFLSGRQEVPTDEVVLFMETYAKVHFVVEEALMRQHPHPEVEGHMASHRAFEEKVSEDFLYRTGMGSRILTIQVLEYLRDWLVHHIGEEDRALARAVRAAQA